MLIDYSLYLVTDSTEAVLGAKDLASVVLAAVEGGAFPLFLPSHSEMANPFQALLSFNIVTKPVTLQT